MLPPPILPNVTNRMRKSDYEKISMQLLDVMETSRKDWLAKDLCEWYNH